jgi:hypothetical protein
MVGSTTSDIKVVAASLFSHVGDEERGARHPGVGGALAVAVPM